MTVDVSTAVAVDDFRQIARERLAADVFEYIDGAAGSEASARRNQSDLAALRLIPRVLRGLDQIDTTATVLASRQSFPVLIAPSAAQRLVHPDGELATARACLDAGTTMVLSMNSGTPVEEVAATGVSFAMQLYLVADRGHVHEVVDRAVAAGATSIVITVDQAGLAVRPRELRHPLQIPDWFKFAHLPTDPAEREVDRTISWADVDWVRSISPVPIAVKGVLHPDDASIALDHGVDAIIVSNHGGRQLDASVSAWEVLPSIVAAVGGRCDVLADGGVSSGSDVLRALALGADAALVGRPISWGLAAGGEVGVARVIDILRAEFVAAMRLCGAATLEQIGPDLLATTRGVVGDSQTGAGVSNDF